MKDNNLTIATWVLAGLLIFTVLLLAFAPLTESIDVNDGSRHQTTFFQNPTTLGPTSHLVNAIFHHLEGAKTMDMDGAMLIRGFINAALYLIGMTALLVASQCLPFRYGLPMALSLFALFACLTLGSIQGLVLGCIKLPGWSLYAAGTLLSGGFFWLKLVELLRSKKWGAHDGVPAVQDL